MEQKTKILIGILIIAIALIGVLIYQFYLASPPAQPKELKLSDFPEVFKENTLIVIGDNASEIEIQAVNEIADYLENETGNKPLVKKYSEITQEDKKNNLIVVGTPNSNPMLKEVYAMTDVLEVTGVEFPIDSEEEAIRYAKTDLDVRKFIEHCSLKEINLKP